MRLRVLLPVFAVVLCSCGSSAASLASWSSSGSSSSSSCGPQGARTLAASSQARVYASGGSVYGCASGSAQSYRLGSQTLCEGNARVGPVVVSGRLAAYGLTRCFVDVATTEVVVRQLGDGRKLRSFAAVSSPGPESFQSVGSLVLKPDGAIAWIGTASSIARHERSYAVFAASAHHPAHLLDSSLGVRPKSLRLHGSRLSWVDGAQTRHASLF